MDTNATEKPVEEVKTPEAAPTIAPEEDLEAKYAKLEEEKENYRKAYLKEAAKKKDDVDEDEDERMTRIAQKALAESKLAEVAREQDEIIRQTLKENKELKLAQLNSKKEPPAAMGTHSEGTPVRDTMVTPEQAAAFKAKGWTDKDIENYKKNLLRNTR